MLVSYGMSHVDGQAPRSVHIQAKQSIPHIRINIETMSPVGYGAVNVHDEFDEKNTYYLNESRCNWNRFFRAVVPVVIALVIMGGFAYGMSHG